MASSFTVPCVTEMVELHTNGLWISIIFPIDANGFASVSSLHLSIRFSLHDSTLWVERKIYDSVTSLLSLTMRKNPRIADNGSSMWKLCAGNTGCTDSQVLTQMYPWKSVPLPIPLLPLSTLLPWSKLQLNPVYTLSYIFFIPQMVMSPPHRLPFTSHPQA